jgi:hypothetical protein
VHCIDDKPNGIILNHDGDWSGDVRIAWYIAGERRDPGPTPSSLRECWCVGPDLVAGRFTPTSGPPGEPSPSEPPVNVLTRAVALAVEGYLRFQLGRAYDDLFIRRGKL